MSGMRFLFFTAIVTLGLAYACESSEEQEGSTIVEGEFRFKGRQSAFIELPPVHYKFAEVTRREIEVDDDGRFSVRLDPGESGRAWIVFGDDRYPAYLQEGERHELKLDGAEFPENVEVMSGAAEANRQYQKFQEAQKEIDRNIDEASDGFAEDPDSPVPEYHRERIALAEQYLGDTRLDFIADRMRGEYIVKLLERVRHHRDHPEFDAEAERREALVQAQEMGVFTESSLKAQRAGIRDIANAFAMSHGIREELEARYGEGLGTYELNRLAYEELDSLRTRILDFIDNRDAEAHARMYLVAGRIGEAPFEKAEPTYEAYMEEFSEYETYTSFLRRHYEKVAAVQPGNPALDFTYEDIEGNEYTLENFEGRQVLLTFWASWCANCAYQKPYMREVHEQYADEGFEIVAISIEENRQAWQSAVLQEDFPWVDLYAGGAFRNELFMDYRAGSIPFYVLIDEEGIIRGVNDVRPSHDLEARLEEIFAETVAAKE